MSTTSAPYSRAELGLLGGRADDRVDRQEPARPEPARLGPGRDGQVDREPAALRVRRPRRAGRRRSASGPGRAPRRTRPRRPSGAVAVEQELGPAPGPGPAHPGRRPARRACRRTPPRRPCDRGPAYLRTVAEPAEQRRRPRSAVAATTPTSAGGRRRGAVARLGPGRSSGGRSSDELPLDHLEGVAELAVDARARPTPRSPSGPCSSRTGGPCRSRTSPRGSCSGGRRTTAWWMSVIR